MNNKVVDVVSLDNIKKQKRLGKKMSWIKVKSCWQLYLMLLIPLCYTLIFNYYPMAGVQIAFKDFNFKDGIFGSPWAGLRHFKTFFESYYFKRTFTNTLKISVYSLLINFPLHIIFALLMNILRNLRFKKVVQTVTYMPHFISTVVLVGMIFQIFNPVTGIYGSFYKNILETSYPPNLFADPKAFIHLYIWSGLWQGLGWGSIIYIAALTSVDVELHEAAEIDGANRFKRVLYIDIPAIIPTASIMLILSFGRIMNVGFEKVFMMQNDMNLVYSETIATYVYKVGMSGGGTNFSYAAAIGLFRSVINCALLVIVNTLAKYQSSESSSLW